MEKGLTILQKICLVLQMNIRITRSVSGKNSDRCIKKELEREKKAEYF